MMARKHDVANADGDVIPVRLTAADRIAVAGMFLTLMGSLLGVYLHHDRLLVRLETQMAAVEYRLAKLEDKS